MSTAATPPNIRRIEETLSSVMDAEMGGDDQDDLRLTNRLNESRSPYVSPQSVASRSMMKHLELRDFSNRYGDT